MRAAEDDGVHVRGLERLRVLADGGVELLVRRGGLDERDESRAGRLDDVGAGVERVDRVGVAAARDRRLGREDADAPVPRGLHRSVRLGGEHADHRHLEPLLQLRQGRRRGRVAGRDDQLDARVLEIGRDLVREAADLVPRAGAVRTARPVPEVEEVLVGQRDEAFVEDGEAPGAGVEDADGPRVHGKILGGRVAVIAMLTVVGNDPAHGDAARERVARGSRLAPAEDALVRPRRGSARAFGLGDLGRGLVDALPAAREGLLRADRSLGQPDPLRLLPAKRGRAHGEGDLDR